MANDQDENREGQDEGEYHFSDEQMNYEMGDTPPSSEPKPADLKSALLQKIASNRRSLISGAVFVVLVFIVYKMLSPTTPTPSTDITQAAPMKASTPATKQEKVASAAPAATPAAPAMQEAPAITPHEVQQPQPMAEAAPASSPAMAPQQPAQIAASTQVGPVDLKTIMDKLTAVEQENSKLSYLLETEYPQRMTNAQDQQVAIQAKVQDLTTRVANIETALTQITQLLQGNGQGATVQSTPSEKLSSPRAGMVKREPKILYVVQAIIPGRAWLKSESGETVTVAEGDVLRAFGRITKIDPYDGIVEADVGDGKTVTLTYGGSNS